jgi:putative CocE/NonD family hydrolase
MSKNFSSKNIATMNDLYSQTPDFNYKGVTTHSQYLTTRDGNQIGVDVLLPLGLEVGTRLPAILIMTRYWRSFELRGSDPPRRAPIAPREPIADDLVKRGFGMIIVDARGSGASTGVSRHPLTPEEIEDYGQVVDWAVQQPWCNGNVGAVGISYEGTTAIFLTAAGRKAVKAVVPQQFEFDIYTDIALPGGIFNKIFIDTWSNGNKNLDSNKLPDWFPIPWIMRLFLKGVRPVDSDRKTRKVLARALRDHQANTDIYQAMSDVTFRDDYFGNTGVTLDDFSVFSHKAAIESSGNALFTFGSWLDAATADTVIRMFNTFSNPQIGIIGAWSHEKTTQGSPYQKPKSKPDPQQSVQWAMIAQFLEQTLIENKLPQQKTLFYYTLGAETWNQTSVFPLPNTETQTWFFREGKRLSPDAPNAETGSDEYIVDFNTTSGLYNRWHTGLAKPVIYPDRVKEDHRLLTYTSEPLEQDLKITGYPVVTLHTASTEEDGAFFVYLEDIDEEGAVRYITEGLLRGIHHRRSEKSISNPTSLPGRTFKRDDAMPLPRGQFVELTFSLLPTSALIKKGHRVRVAIAGADKHTFARLPPQGNPTLKIARNCDLASQIRLPIVRVS